MTLAGLLKLVRGGMGSRTQKETNVLLSRERQQQD